MDLEKLSRGALCCALVCLAVGLHAPTFANADELRPQLVHSGPITALAVSPEGDLVTTGGFDGVLKMWSASGHLLRTMSGHSSRVVASAWRPDGQAFATLGYDGKLRLWSRAGDALATSDLGGRTDASGRKLGGESSIGGDLDEPMAFSPDGSQLALMAYGLPWIVDVSARGLGTPRQLLRFFQKFSRHWVVRFESSRALEVCGGDDAAWCEILDPKDQAASRELPIEGAKPGISAVAIAPDGSRVVGFADGSVRRVSAKSELGETLREPRYKEGRVGPGRISGIVLDADGKVLMVTTGDGELLGPNAAGMLEGKGKLPARMLPAPVRRGQHIFVSAGPRPIAVGLDGTAALPGTPPASISAFAERGGTLAVVGGSSVHVFSADFERLAVIRSPHLATVHQVAVSSQGDRIGILGFSEDSQELRIEVFDTQGRSVARHAMPSKSRWERPIGAEFNDGPALQFFVRTTAQFVGFNILTNARVDLPNGGILRSASSPPNGSPYPRVLGDVYGDLEVHPARSAPFRIKPAPMFPDPNADAPGVKSSLHHDPFVAGAWDDGRERLFALTATGFLRAFDRRGKELFRRSTFTAESVGRPASESDGRALVAPFEGKSADAVILRLRANHFSPRRALGLDAKGRIATGSWDGTVRLWDADGKLLETQTDPAHDPVSDLAFRGESLFVARGSGALQVVTPLSGPTLEITVSQRDWVAATPDGLFMGSRGAGELIAGVRGERAYPLAQLALRNNRDDLVLERLGRGTEDQRAYYRERHERRARAAGLPADLRSSSTFDLPEVRVTEAHVEGARLRMKIEARAVSGELQRLSVRVDGVPAQLTDLRGASASHEIDLALLSGRNVVEISATDRAGAESLREERTFVLPDAPRPGRLVFVGFGVSRYARVKSLAWAAKDVQDFAAAARLMVGKAFSEVVTRVYVDEQVERAAFADALQYVQSASENDTVVVMVAGHGVYSPRAKQHYFAAHSTAVTDLETTGIPHAMIETLVEKTRSRKKLLLIDTCESGEVEGKPASAGNARASRALVLGTSEPRPRRSYVNERNRYIFNELGDRTGATVLASSLGHEESQEDDAWRNGAFTESILRALASSATDTDADHAIVPNELYATVAADVARMSGDLQHPDQLHQNAKSRLAFPVTASIQAIADRLDVPEALRARAGAVSTTSPTPVIARRPEPVRVRPSGCGCRTAGEAPVGQVEWLALLGLVSVAAAWLARRGLMKAG